MVFEIFLRIFGMIFKRFYVVIVERPKLLAVSTRMLLTFVLIMSTMREKLEECSRSKYFIPVSKQQTQTKKLGHEKSYSPPATYNVDNQVIFSLFVGKKSDRYFPTLIRGNGGYVIQLNCTNYFWPGLWVSIFSYILARCVLKNALNIGQ